MAREMKDSGIEWVKNIPASWEIRRNKTCFDCSKEIIGDKSAETQLLSLTTKGIKQKNASDSAGKVPESYDTYQVVVPNDIVMCLFDLDMSAVFSGISNYYGMISPAYKVLKCKKDMYPQYAAYWFDCVFNGRKFKHYAKNLRYTLNYDEFAILSIIVPPLSEQKQIASYLDAECAYIDAVMEQTRASIEEYKKLKQAVITQAVTKSIRPNRQMQPPLNKDYVSIPQDWSLERLKYITIEIVDCPHETPNYSADGLYYVIRTADQDYAKLRADKDMFRLSQSEYENRIRRLSLDKDDIVYGREGERWGLACLVPESNKYCLGQRMMQFRCNTNKILPQFAVYALSSVYTRRQGEFDTFGSTSPHVNISTIRNYKIPLPGLAEQIEIVTYLDSQMEKIDALITIKEGFIIDMENYKKALIYEYVTGKKEIPNEQER